MKILVSCEFTGVVREAFSNRGHYAVSCDTKDTLILGNHYKGDVRDIINDDWDMIIAFPPCTYLSSSGFHWTVRGIRPFSLTEEAIEFVKLHMENKCEKICIENPVGMISRLVRKPDQIIQPYNFGHSASKKTCLWLKNLPKLRNTLYVPPGSNGRYENQLASGQNRLTPGKDRANIRSKTYQGIANAMAEQWG